MAFKFTKNVKVAMMLSDGEIVFEFRRPTNEEKNSFLHAQLDLKSDGKEKSNAVDEMRVAFYDQFIEKVYIEKNGEKDDIVGEDDKPLSPRDFPAGVKVNTVLRAFEIGGVYAKNL